MKYIPHLCVAAAVTVFFVSKSCAQDPAPAAPPAAAPATPAPATPAPAPAAPAPAAAAEGDTAKIALGVIPMLMKFDKTEFEVKAGQKVMILFSNKSCPLQHNLLVLKPGTKDKVGALADKLLADPNALKTNYTPVSDDILAHSNKLVGISQNDLIEFTAPKEPGDYPYICSFPGHWRMMNGVMKVK